MALADLVSELLRDRAGRPPAPVEGSSLTVVDEFGKDTSLLEFLRRTARHKRTVHPPGPSSWWRASGLPYVCPREEVLAGLTGTVRYDEVTPDEQMTYGVGSGWHFVMQNEFLGPHGILFGKWDCWGCHKIYGEDMRPARRPKVCERCGGDRFLYEEIFLKNDEYKISGHPDGIIELDRRKRVLELKSINENGFKNRVDMAPDPNHVIQINLYLWLTGLRDGLIVYQNKNGYGLRGLRAYEVDYDQDLVSSMLSTISTVRHCLRTGNLPPRLIACDRPGAARVKECPLGKRCFGCKDRLDEAA